MKHVVILGNGISGITAARHIRKHSDFKITVISAETDHFFSRTALMYIYMGHMKYEHTKPYEDYFWAKNRIELVRAWVKEIHFKEKEFLLDTGARISYDTLILGVGSVPNSFGWPGQELPGVQGLYSYQDLEQMEESTEGVREAVIVGGGLIGIEMAEMLRTRGIKVTMLVREKEYWNGVLPDEEARMIGHHVQEHSVELLLSTELKEIVADPSTGRVSHIVTQQGTQISCQFVGLTVGVRPNIDQFKNTALETEKGILVNEYLETNLPDVYAIGDCVQHRTPPQNRKAVEQIWYTGRIMGETVARTICQARTAYQPGVFFNSAKFFDIEYQTYGSVPAQLPEGTRTFFWKHPTENIALRFNYLETTHVLTGINVFGMRLRHEVCQQWLKGRKTVGYVFLHFKDAHFDPEFYPRHKAAIVEAYNSGKPDYRIRYEHTPSFWERLFSR